MDIPSPITRDTPFVPEDDGYHRQGADPLNLETNWWAINIPERGIGAWIHSAYYPNRGKLRWRTFAWDPRGADRRDSPTTGMSRPRCRANPTCATSSIPTAAIR